MINPILMILIFVTALVIIYTVDFLGTEQIIKKSTLKFSHKKTSALNALHNYIS